MKIIFNNKTLLNKNKNVLAQKILVKITKHVIRITIRNIIPT